MARVPRGALNGLPSWARAVWCVEESRGVWGWKEGKGGRYG